MNRAHLDSVWGLPFRSQNLTDVYCGRLSRKQYGREDRKVRKAQTLLTDPSASDLPTTLCKGLTLTPSLSAGVKGVRPRLLGSWGTNFIHSTTMCFYLNRAGGGGCQALLPRVSPNPRAVQGGQASFLGQGDDGTESRGPEVVQGSGGQAGFLERVTGRVFQEWGAEAGVGS